MTRLYKKPNSPYWFCDLRPYGGSRCSTKRLKKMEAREVADAMAKSLMDRQQLGRSEDMTLGGALRRAAGLAGGSYQRAILDSARRICGDWDGPKMDPEMLMADLDTRKVAAWRDARLAHDVAARSTGNDMRILRRVYNLCLKEWSIAVQPLVVFKPPPTATRRRRLLADEEARLLAALDPGREVGGVPNEGPRRQQMQDAYDLTVILIDTGMRVGEACALRWNDVSLQDGIITVFRPKTDTESIVGMTSRVRQLLQRRRAGSDGHVYVFPRWTSGFRMDPSRPRSGHYSTGAIERAIERAGLNADEALVARAGRFTVHSFRDTFASRLIERGLSKRATQDLMGHSTSYMVDKYTHLEGRDQAKQAALLLSQ